MALTVEPMSQALVSFKKYMPPDIKIAPLKFSNISSE
jgi:hypothetical protein